MLTKNLVRRMSLFYILTSLYNAWLKGRQLDFTSASAFILLQTVVLAETCEENLNLIVYVCGKGTSISLVFLDNCEYGFFKNNTNPHLNRGSFFKGC